MSKLTILGNKYFNQKIIPKLKFFTKKSTNFVIGTFFESRTYINYVHKQGGRGHPNVNDNTKYIILYVVNF